MFGTMVLYHDVIWHARDGQLLSRIPSTFFVYNIHGVTSTTTWQSSCLRHLLHQLWSWAMTNVTSQPHLVMSSASDSYSINSDHEPWQMWHHNPTQLCPFLPLAGGFSSARPGGAAPVDPASPVLLLEYAMPWGCHTASHHMRWRSMTIRRLPLS